MNTIQTKLDQMRTDNHQETGLTTCLDPQSSRKYAVLAKKAAKGQFEGDTADIRTMSNTIKTTIDRMIKEQSDDRFLTRVSLPRLPPAHRPVVMIHRSGVKAFVAENDAHSKESNFGYSRNKFGGFYNH